MAKRNAIPLKLDISDEVSPLQEFQTAFPDVVPPLYGGTGLTESDLTGKAGNFVVINATGDGYDTLSLPGGVTSSSITLVQRSLEGVVYETTLMYWRALAACTIQSVSMSLSSNPSATGSYCKVQVMKNGLLETDSIFTSDTPMQITETTTAVNGVYTGDGTLDENQTSLAAGDVIHFRVNQADTGSADLLIQMVVTSPDYTGTLDGGSA